jgi:hypothetical protein
LLGGNNSIYTSHVWSKGASDAGGTGVLKNRGSLLAARRASLLAEIAGSLFESTASQERHQDLKHFADLLGQICFE